MQVLPTLALNRVLAIQFLTDLDCDSNQTFKAGCPATSWSGVLLGVRLETRYFDNYYLRLQFRVSAEQCQTLVP